MLLLALLLLPFEERSSAEFVVTVLAALVGLAFAGAVALLARRAAPRMPRDSGTASRYNRRDSSQGRER